MHVQALPLAERYPPDARGLRAVAQRASGRARGEADRELLADLAVVVGDHVGRVAVDADDAGDLDLDPGLLAHLPHEGVANALADLNPAAGERPLAVVAALDQEDALVVEHHAGDRRDERVGLRRARIVVEVAPGHQAAIPPSSSGRASSRTRSKLAW